MLGLLLALPQGLLGQDEIPCFPPPVCGPQDPSPTDPYCNADVDGCETRCANLNLLILTTPAARAFSSSSNSNSLHEEIIDQIGRFRQALNNSNINNKTVTYSIYDDDGTYFNRGDDIRCDVIQSLPNNGNIQQLRSQYKADMVIVIPYDPSLNYLGGIAAKIGPDNSKAYSIITASILFNTEFVLAHEIGHLLGARHHRDDLDLECIDDIQISDCQHAWRYTASNGQKVRTIMAGAGPNAAYNTRIPYFSGPNVVTNLGDIAANTNTSQPATNNAGIIARTFCQAADFVSPDKIVLQNIEGDSRDAFVQYVAPFFNLPSPVNGINYGSSESINLSSVMLPGAFGLNFFSKKRVYLDFNWNRIPPSSEIVEARLSLYYNPDDLVEVTNGHVGNNQFSIRRVISGWPATNWGEQTITWNNQPQATSSNEVIVAASNSNTQNYLSVDVTDLVKDMFDPCAIVAKHGFQLRLLNEGISRAVVLASSEHPNPNIRPKLEITFNSCKPFPVINCLSLSRQASPNTDLLKVFPNPTSGKLNLQFTEAQDSQIALSDLRGKRVLNRQFTGQSEAKISLGHLPKGVYLLKVLAGGQQHSQKIYLQ
ncbi:MAG: DNRLRE domain-containing protein [Bacteroidota bacterium]